MSTCPAPPVRVCVRAQLLCVALRCVGLVGLGWRCRVLLARWLRAKLRIYIHVPTPVQQQQQLLAVRSSLSPLLSLDPVLSCPLARVPIGNSWRAARSKAPRDEQAGRQVEHKAGGLVVGWRAVPSPTHPDPPLALRKRSNLRRVVVWPSPASQPESLRSRVCIARGAAAGSQCQLSPSCYLLPVPLRTLARPGPGGVNGTDLRGRARSGCA